jgi:hypothetical protein
MADFTGPDVIFRHEGETLIGTQSANDPDGPTGFCRRQAVETRRTDAPDRSAKTNFCAVEAHRHQLGPCIFGRFQRLCQTFASFFLTHACVTAIATGAQQHYLVLKLEEA